MLGLLAAFAALACEMPRLAAIPVATNALLYGFWLARREWRKPVHELVIAADGAQAVLDGSPITALELQWRGPVAFLRYRDGQDRLQRLIWWPDVLAAGARRELRLAVPVKASASPVHSMAP